MYFSKKCVVLEQEHENRGPGACFGGFRTLLGLLGAALGRSEAALGVYIGGLGRFGVALGPSVGGLGQPWGLCGRSRRLLDGSGDAPGPQGAGAQFCYHFGPPNPPTEI